MTPCFYYNVHVETGGLIPCYRSEKAEGCPMPDTYLNGRPVYFGDIAHGPEDSCDSYFESASYADNDTDLSEAELDTLTAEHGEYLDAAWFEHLVARAEYARD